MTAHLIFVVTAILTGSPAAPIYRFHPKADRLLEILFPQVTTPVGLLAGYYPPSVTYKSLDDVLSDYLAAEKPTARATVSVPLNHDSIESYYLSISNTQGWDALLDKSNTVSTLALIRSLATDRLRFVSPLEKALFQRDIVQAISFLQTATDSLKRESSLRANAIIMQRELIQLVIDQLLLASDEWDAFQAQRPRTIDPMRYTTVNTWDVSDDYLPEAVLDTDSSWLQLPIESDATRHSQVYRGRSVIHLLLRIPGVAPREMIAWWEEVNAACGDRLLVDPCEPVPKGTETMLIRTFRILLENGEWVDSGYPEEVLIRTFQYAHPRLDLHTSDFRGTNQYQYKLSRRMQLERPSSLGLHRIRHENPQFLGFFSEVTDPYHSLGAPLTSMRHNCINCHSPLFYGTNTMFFLRVKPSKQTGQQANPKHDGIRRQSPEVETLRRRIREHYHARKLQSEEE